MYFSTKLKKNHLFQYKTVRIVDALQSVQHLCHTFKNSSGERGLRLLLTSPKFSAIAWSGSNFFILLNSLFSNVDM